MAAYVIAEIEVKDAEGYKEYQRMGPPTVAAFGGEFVVRGGRAEVLEGDGVPKRPVILRFDNFERAKEWWNSEEYRPAKQIRQKTAKSRMIVVEGV